ncbi:MarR family transcriptional regulator [Phenylobacterium sp.]|jgi:DNA-binding MarR family transcriptional regulator|uniref:MarR family winged helix-turn-helix transcriptional regulator n=1 Tax=Phenylobacterium sp. TaxID=1871053 RepID=UPI002E36FBCD|nr:MarR family transcriptional regulator [Phenylobacterium sp.]HEX3363915.1 MarR family transcriptional regulator [Phenylobacterium sp.]
MKKPRALRLAAFVPYRLSIATNTVSEVIAGAYRTLFGLNIPEWRLIAVLAEKGGATQLDLGAATRMDKVTVSRAAIALVARGLMRRAPNPRDKRSHLLSLTAQGRALYDQVAPKALALEDTVLADFSAEEVDTLIAMLRRLEASAARVGGREP